MPHQVRDLLTMCPVVHRERFHFSRGYPIKERSEDLRDELPDVDIELTAEAFFVRAKLGSVGVPSSVSVAVRLEAFHQAEFFNRYRRLRNLHGSCLLSDSWFS